MIKKLSEFQRTTEEYSSAIEALLNENGFDISDPNVWENFPDTFNNKSLFNICCNLPKIKNIDEAAAIIKQNISSKHFCIMGDYDKQI